MHAETFEIINTWLFADPNASKQTEKLGAARDSPIVMTWLAIICNKICLGRGAKKIRVVFVAFVRRVKSQHAQLRCFLRNSIIHNAGVCVGERCFHFYEHTLKQQRSINSSSSCNFMCIFLQQFRRGRGHILNSIYPPGLLPRSVYTRNITHAACG